MQRILLDLRYALRQLKNSPGFALTAVMILAVGIGATTAIYTLIDQALLRAMPVQDPQRLVQLNGSGSFEGHTHSYGQADSNYFSYPMYERLRDRNQVLSGVLATSTARVGVQWHHHSELANAELVSGNYFHVLGLEPAVGRLLLPADNRVKNGSPVVVLSNAYWREHMGADPRVVGQTLGVDGQPFTIVGVTPAGFHSVLGGTAPDFFTPMMMKPEVIPGSNDLANEHSRWLLILARLKPGMTRAQAQAGLEPLWHALRADELSRMANHSARFGVDYVAQSHLTLRDGSRGFSLVAGDVRMPFLIVLFMAVLVLVMACANVAGLMLVRAAGRVREISVRYALGATRRQIVQQLLLEGLVLGAAAGAAGFWLAPRLATLLERQILDQTTGDLPFSTHPDGRMLAFTAAVSLAVAVLFSLVPAVQFWKRDVTPALKQQVASVTGGWLRIQRAAVGVQVGLSVLLLVAAGLFVRTLYNLKAVNVGFPTDHLIQFRVDPLLSGYDPGQSRVLLREILTRLRSLPGTRAAGATTDPVLANWNTTGNITVAGYHAAEREDTDAEQAFVTPGYFSALGTPLLAGRTITDADTATSAKVVVVNESLARHYFGDPRQALGHAIGLGGGKNAAADMTIVGIVRDSRHTAIDAPDATAPALYMPAEQARTPEQMAFYIRTAQPPTAAMGTVRKAMHALDSKLILSDFSTMDDQVNEDLESQRTVALLAASFGLLALLICAVGLYAVLSYATAQRTREIGLRIALGASRGSIARLVVLDVLRLTAVSAAVALPVAWLMTHWIRGQLYGVSGHDPATLLGVPVVMFLIALLAALLPVRRALGVDPLAALRYE